MTGAEDKALDEQAAFWFARLRAEDVADHDRARFSEWLAEDARHPEVYAGYEALWDAVGAAGASEAILGMRAQALASTRPGRTGPPRRRIAAVAASLAVLALGGLMVLRPWGALEVQGPAPVLAAAAPSVYATEVGERSTIVLEDGSTVVLNTDSVLQVSYGERRRGLRLLRGQAVFEVAHDAARPFVVEAGGQTITALGTVFDVHVDGEETRVTLIEGEIAVERRGGESGLFSRPVEISRLTAGQELVAVPTQPFQVHVADLDRTVGWRSGRVSFSDEPLSEVLEEINRYSTRRVVLGDADLAGMRVSGAFNTGSAERFVAALELGFPVRAQRDEARDVIVLTRR